MRQLHWKVEFVFAYTQPQPSLIDHEPQKTEGQISYQMSPNPESGSFGSRQGHSDNTKDECKTYRPMGHWTQK